MGMTIDDHIKILKSYYNGFTGWAGNFQESIDVAVDIMSKYQKIEQIYQKWNEVNDCSYNQAMQEIGEGLKDGETSN